MKIECSFCKTEFDTEKDDVEIYIEDETDTKKAVIFTCPECLNENSYEINEEED